MVYKVKKCNGNGSMSMDDVNLIVYHGSGRAKRLTLDERDKSFKIDSTFGDVRSSITYLNYDGKYIALLNRDGYLELYKTSDLANAIYKFRFTLRIGDPIASWCNQTFYVAQKDSIYVFEICNETVYQDSINLHVDNSKQLYNYHAYINHISSNNSFLVGTCQLRDSPYPLIILLYNYSKEFITFTNHKFGYSPLIFCDTRNRIFAFCDGKVFIYDNPSCFLADNALLVHIDDTIPVNICTRLSHHGHFLTTPNMRGEIILVDVLSWQIMDIFCYGVTFNSSFSINDKYLLIDGNNKLAISLT